MIRPQALTSRDCIRIVAPAGVLKAGDLDNAVNILQQWGLKVETGNHVFDSSGFLSSSDSGRLADFQNALDDDIVRAIFCARGGFGTGKILDKIDFNNFLENPKWIIGFSDITLLHLKLHSIGVMSIHGIVARQMGSTVDDASTESLRKILFGRENIIYRIGPSSLNKTGNVRALIVGGNLTLLCNNIGTSSDISFDGKILFVEDTNESFYAIDRNFNQLARSGKLDDIAGLIAGEFTGSKDTVPPYGKTVYEILLEYTAAGNYPVCFGFPVGHGHRNLSIPFSADCILDVKTSGIRIEFMIG